MKGDFQVRFRENLRVKLPWVTRLAVIGQARGQRRESRPFRFRKKETKKYPWTVVNRWNSPSLWSTHLQLEQLGHRTLF